MRIRTITELIDSSCPNCGEANYGGDTYCRSCGNKLIAGSSVSEGATDEDLKELATAHKAVIVSKLLPEHKLTFDTILLVIFGPALATIFSLGIACEQAEKEELLSNIVTLAVILFPFYCLLLYLIAASPVIKYKTIVNEGGRYPAVLIGHCYGMLHGKSDSNINSRSVYPCIKVLTKIAGVDTSIVLFVPEGITEHTCPIGTEITVIGHDDKFVIDPKCRQRLIRDFKRRKAGKTG